MDRSSDKDKSSKRSRDDRDRYSKHRDSDSHRRHHRSDRHSHKSSRREDRESSRERSQEPRSASRREEDREKSRERSYDPREERQGSEERGRDGREATRERSYDESEDSERERGRRKRKERGQSEEKEKRVRVSEDKREKKRKFEDKVKNEDNNNNTNDSVDDNNNNDINNGSIRNSSEIEVKEEVNDLPIGHGGGTSNSNGDVLAENGASVGSFTNTSSVVPETSMAPIHPLPIKVSSISNTNENKGVSITRSHEVPGKSSTDGTSSAAGRSGSLSLDALAKAKLALQKKKELSEKLQKLSQMSKVASQSSDGGLASRLKEGSKSQSSGTGAVQGLAPSITADIAVSAGTISSSSTVPAATSVNPSASGLVSIPGLATNIEAVKRAQELAAKMGFRQDPQFGPLINLFPGQVLAEVAVPQKPTKAPVLRLDALGREIDENGNVVNVTKPSNLSTLKVNINKQKKDAFQILKPELEVDPDSNPHYDPRMGINKSKLLRPKRMTFQFVEEGKWSKEAEAIKVKNKYGEERAKELKAKQALHAKAKSAPDINPNFIEVAERVIIKEKQKDTVPDVEWWDVPILSTGAYGEIKDGLIAELNLKVDKITIYVEHPRPIEPPAEPAPPPPQPLKLTKKEQKKLRTQRRLAREKDRQEMIRQGLIEPPKPKVKMSNLMKVLGSEATQDPTRLEKEIRTAAADREQAHIDRNIARKLTPAERREKKERKLFDDPNTLETIVSVYRINDLTDKKTRFKVDINAHENRLTGCCVICQGINVVVVEGGTKSIKRYGKLMLKRINWAEATNEDEEGDDNDDKPANKCVLVWQGSAAKPSFHKFSVQECITEAAARKVFADAGVAHYWDLAVNFSDDQM